MPKKRIIAMIVVRHGIVVQSIDFTRYLPVGRPEIAAWFLDGYDVDEIVLVDITATAEGRTISPQLVERVAARLFVPLTVGGGVRSVSDMRALLNAGADKIAMNEVLVAGTDLVGEAAAIFGSQCLVGSIDARQVGSGYQAFTANGRINTGLAPSTLARRLQTAGIGEILINSIDRDGRRTGFDETLILSVAQAVDVPVIAVGGAGVPDHFATVLRHDAVSAAAAANIFHYTEHSVALLKAYLAKKGIDLKRGRHAGYDSAAISEDGRLQPRHPAELAEQIFEEIREERL